MRNANYRDFSEAQENALLEGIMKYGAAPRCHAMLAAASGEPAGSGVCVTSGGRRGILTARHVLYVDGGGEERLPNPVIGFAPPRSKMIQEQRRRQHERRSGREPLGPFQMIGISIGDRVTGVPLQRKRRFTQIQDCRILPLLCSPTTSRNDYERLQTPKEQPLLNQNGSI